LYRTITVTDDSECVDTGSDPQKAVLFVLITSREGSSLKMGDRTTSELYSRSQWARSGEEQRVGKSRVIKIAKTKEHTSQP
jgi:hypothetical protein